MKPQMMALAMNTSGQKPQKARPFTWLSGQARLGNTSSRHRDTGIMLVWSPVVREWVQDSTVRFKALQACKLTSRASLNRVQSAAPQKRLMRKCAYAKWAAEWLEDQRSGKHTHSHSYQFALPFPPDRKSHPLWLAARKTLWPDGDFPPTRHTTTTALRFATGHAFTSYYAC